MLPNFALELGLRWRPRLARFWGRSRPHPRFLKSPSEEAAIYHAIGTRLFPREADRRAYREVWDVGCRNWSYAETLAALFPEADLVGVEVDPDRLYWDLSTRRTVATAHAERIREQGRQVRLEFRDFHNCDLKMARSPLLISHFFPYVSDHPCRQGGLPTRFADFAALLARSPHGSHVISCHQGEWEGAAALKAYERAGLRITHEATLTQNNSTIGDFPYSIAVLRATV